jgi:hypothetical protein
VEFIKPNPPPNLQAQPLKISEDSEQQGEMAWYVWISLWLLGASLSHAHLIPVADPEKERLIVGHNISFYRADALNYHTLTKTQQNN